ncbi:MAG: galactokinase [Thermoleophilaceae bacterium]
MTAESVVAFGPGRVNLIGEHTDYNDGLSLPFAIDRGVRVSAVANEDGGFVVDALDLGERDCFDVPDRGVQDCSDVPGLGEHDHSDVPVLGEPDHSDVPGLGEHDHSETRSVQAVRGWRAFVRGTVAELERAGYPLRPARIEITATVAGGSGLSSSAALEVALSLALLALAGHPDPDRLTLAKLCSRVENRWVEARTGLLDQIASLFGEPASALRIDFRTLEVRPVPVPASGWRFVTVSSGETHSLARSGYNERRAECERARELLALDSLRDAQVDDADRLPEPIRSRVLHVIGENARVEAMVSALEADDAVAAGRLLNDSHRSLRDLFDASTPAVEGTVERLRDVGAAGARMMGGGFGGVVLGLLPKGVAPPRGAQIVEPSAGGRLLA